LSDENSSTYLTVNPKKLVIFLSRSTIPLSTYGCGSKGSGDSKGKNPDPSATISFKNNSIELFMGETKKAVCTVVVKKKSTSMKGIIFDKVKATESQSIHGINGAGELTMNLSPSPDKPGEYKGNFHIVRTFD